MSTSNNIILNQRNWLYYLQLFLLCSVLSPCFGQGNYIRIRTATEPVVSGTVLSSLNSLTNISYYDTAGRLIQEVAQGITPSGTDMATLNVYDGLNRVKQRWEALPFSSTDGRFHPIQEFTGSDYASHYHTDYSYIPAGLQYSVDESNAFSPNKAIRTEYLVNTDSEEALSVVFYSGYSHPDYRLQKSGTYPEGSLKCVKVTDEDGNSTYSFYDSQENLILDRRQNTDGWYDTYYIYDDFFQLSCILPPPVHVALAEQVNYDPEMTTILQQYGYFYRYDRYGHRTWRKLPGAKWEYTVYDGDHRPVLYRSNNHAQKEYWAYKQYDGLGRIAVEGLAYAGIFTEKLVNTYSKSLIKVRYTGEQAGRFGYTEKNIEGFNPQKVEQVYYYDDYNFLSLPLFKEITSSPTTQACTHSLPTGRYIAMLDQSGGYELEVYYYDTAGRCIQTDRYNSISRTTTHINSVYNFLNAPVQTTDRFITPKSTLQRTMDYAYDRAGRETEADISFLFQRMDGSCSSNNFPLRRNHYDEFGRINRQELFNKQDEILTDYGNDGRLHGASNRHFSQQLYYSDLGVSGQPYYNGLISGTQIKQNGQEYLLTMSYDALGRYMLGEMYDPSGTNHLGWSESFVFDKMGNVEAINHIGPLGQANALHMTYEGNHLKRTDNRNWTMYPPYEYAHMFCNWDKDDNGHAYDANGNETKNIAAGIQHMGYNLMNLPDTLAASEYGNTAHFTYQADGKRIRSTYYTYPYNMEYLLKHPEIFNDPSFVYEEIRDGDLLFRDGKLSQVDFPGGYLEIDPRYKPGPNYYYFITDYLGSVRTTCDGATGEAIQQLEYLPSGIVFNKDDLYFQNRRFCGKEAIDMHGYGLYDSKARFQHAKYQQFVSIDPLCEKYPGVSPYVYCMNNPVNCIDPDGRDWYRHNESGDYFWREGHEELDGYTKIGSSVSIKLGENSYLNCYQNGGIWANQAVKAVDLIRSNANLKKQFLGKNSVLSDQSQTELFVTLNSRDVDEFARPIGEALVEFGAAELGGALAGKLIGWGARGISRLFGKTATETGTYSVYYGYDAAGEVRYVGITSREPAIRFKEHLKSGTARAKLKYRKVKGATKLTKDQARMQEQTLINKYGLSKNGGMLLNKINSIAPKYWEQYGIK